MLGGGAGGTGRRGEQGREGGTGDMGQRLPGFMLAWHCWMALGQERGSGS